MIRSITYLVIITAVAGFLTLGCKQQDSATDTADTKTGTETTTTTETDTGSSSQTEPETPEDTARQTPDETAETETGQDEQIKVTEWKEATPEEVKENMQRRRKEFIDHQMSEGLYTGIEEGPTVKVYVADSFHDLEEADQIRNIQIIYAYYNSVNPDVETVIAYDQKTSSEIMKVDSESFSEKKEKIKKKKKKKDVDEAQ
jgi:hypothetical protein